ncbi:MAG: uroporphyrinogen-III synthase [Flavipsychrobacter sp.]|nr:uroporphyrinogen-III synthase [Flavipsychrobacter sp.]
MKKISILSTAILGEDKTGAVDTNLFSITELAFIDVRSLDGIELRTSINSYISSGLPVVFTSKNSVKAVSALVGDNKPEWKIYSLGPGTSKVVAQLFPGSTIVGTAPSAEGLAEIIVSDGNKEVVFFCGDMRLDTLPERLGKAAVRVRETIVYETISSPETIDGIFDGILFFSPSGVKSFFEANKVGPETVLFAVGSTTAAEVAKYTGNKIFVSEVPKKEEVLKTAIGYFLGNE